MAAQGPGQSTTEPTVDTPAILNALHNGTYVEITGNIINGVRNIQTVDIWMQHDAMLDNPLNILRLSRGAFMTALVNNQLAMITNSSTAVTPFVPNFGGMNKEHTLAMLQVTIREYGLTMTGEENLVDVYLGFVCPFLLAGQNCPLAACRMISIPLGYKQTCASQAQTPTATCTTSGCMHSHDMERSLHFAAAAEHQAYPNRIFLSSYYGRVLDARYPGRLG